MEIQQWPKCYPIYLTLLKSFPKRDFPGRKSLIQSFLLAIFQSQDKFLTLFLASLAACKNALIFHAICFPILLDSKEDLGLAWRNKSCISFLQCQAQCPYGKYGLQCKKSCLCKNGATCNPVDGSCACPDGWQGTDCGQRSCRDPTTYGPHCSLICSCDRNNTEL